jgi:flagellar protein FliT
MMNSQELLSIYENVAVITDQMLAAARAGDWDQLATLESHCAAQVEMLKAEERRPLLTDAVRERKVQIIQKILADDREIRNLTEPWMAQLSGLINSTGIERKLSNTYGAHQLG